MKPFIKWPGGKADELGVILSNTPPVIERYFEPFVGGGAVYLGIKDCTEFFINDKSAELMSLYDNIKAENPEFLQSVGGIDKCWKLIGQTADKYMAELTVIYNRYKSEELTEEKLNGCIKTFLAQHADELNGMLTEEFIIDTCSMLNSLQTNVKEKMKRMKKLEAVRGQLSSADVWANIETGFKSGLYMHFRYLYNNFRELNIDDCFESALFYFMREYCYSSMFRYNKDGKFNVPYGGMSYNNKPFYEKLSCINDPDFMARLKKTNISSLDFEAFFSQNIPGQNDFVFLDPPYDTAFSTYSQNLFNGADHQRLANFCRNTKGKFLLVIKNTDFIYNLYKDFNLSSFDKKYTVSFQNRNDKCTEHLIVRNY